MRNSAEIIYGYLFTTQELVDSLDLRVLTPNRLSSLLRRRTKLLDIEIPDSHEMHVMMHELENVNLRTGFYIGDGEISRLQGKNQKYKSERFLIGTCLAEVGNYHNREDLGKVVEYDDRLLTVVQEFKKVFPRKDWKEEDFNQFLYIPSYSRDILKKRIDYSIKGR